jgi:hypothetical protein
LKFFSTETSWARSVQFKSPSETVSVAGNIKKGGKFLLLTQLLSTLAVSPASSYLVETLTQSSKISPPSKNSHWWVITMPAPCFKTYGLYGTHLANPRFPAIPFSLESSRTAPRRKTPRKLSSETMVTQSLGATNRMLFL